MQHDFDDLLQPICNVWLEKIKLAKEAKKAFKDVADQCTDFFKGPPGFMWEKEHMKRFLRKGQSLAPKFTLTMNKAFELVAQFGPSLYWNNPQRVVRRLQQFQFDPSILGPPDDPNVQAMAQQIQMEEQQRESVANMRNQLMELALNYFPTEIPFGGRKAHARQAVDDALITGRGVGFCQTYKMPGSDRTLVGTFYESVDDLFIDPDCADPLLEGAHWIALRCNHAIWEVEREYGYKSGALEGCGSEESANSQAEGQDEDTKDERRRGRSFDRMTYYKIWSKAGIGTRLKGCEAEEWSDYVNEVVGDHVYLVIAPSVPFPLNAPPDELREARENEDEASVRRMFDWPIPFWMDNAWPISLLDFYPLAKSPWPLAPMSPGLGYLIFMNLLVSSLASNIWDSNRIFVAAKKAFTSDIESLIKKGENLTVFPVGEAAGNIKDMISFMQIPQVNYDVWRILDAVSAMFDKATGLTEMAYGLNPGGVQSRSATDAQSKEERFNVRPDYMASKIEDWETSNARLEKFATRWAIRGQDIEPRVGKYGAQLWEQLIVAEDPELVVREMDASIEAGSARKPNKGREVQNINTIMPVLFGELSNHANVTGDTNPLNAMIRRLGQAHDIDMSDLQMGPRTPASPPPPPPEVQQEQETYAQLEQQKHQAEVQKAILAVQEAELELQAKAAELQGGGSEQAKAEAELALEVQKHQMELQQDQQQHEQELQQDREKHQMEIQQQRGEMELDLLMAQQDLSVKRETAQQQLQMQAMQGRQQLTLQERTGQQQLRQSEMSSQQQLQAAKQQNTLKAQQAAQAPQQK